MTRKFKCKHCKSTLAVNRERGKSDYIPCIVWGGTAAHIGTLDVGVKVSLQGRLQTLPDDYTSEISNSQRYKCLGNGWTVDVIAHIFSFI